MISQPAIDDNARATLDHDERADRLAGSLWYPRVPYVGTKRAANDAQRIAAWIAEGGVGKERPDEEALFAALHTCAFRARPRPTDRPAQTQERKEWFQRWIQIRDHLVRENLGLVYSTLQRFSGTPGDESDLRSDAFLALLQAVDRFNPWRGYRFSSYAVSAIQHALIYRGKHEYRHRRLFPASFDASFEEPVRPDEDTELYTERLQRALDRNLGSLTDLETRILAERFPTDDRRRPTLRELSSVIGISKERVRQIQQRALDKLREALGADRVLQ
jgi:RNA polymerase sigma factor (sigma-70 family)